MSYPDPEIVKSDGLLRLKWEEERERASCPDLLCFGTADMDYRSPEPVLASLKSVLERGHLGYPKIPDLYYETIHNWLLHIAGWNVDTRCCVLQNSGVYVLAWGALQLLTKPGDAVVILTPVHSVFKELLTLNNRKTLECPLMLKNGFYEIDFSFLEGCLASGAKVLWLCNPHNPVGRAWTREELKKIADLCLRYQVTILSDDVYCGLTYAGKPYTPIASLSQEISYHTITFYSTSKTYNTTALRHAFMVSENPELTKRYSELLTSMGVSYGQNLMGLEATIAAFRECEPWRIRLMEQIAANHRFLKAAFEKNMPECKVLQAEATYFAWIDLRALDIRPAQLTYLLEQETQIVVENGFRLGKGGAGFIRFNLATSQENLHEGTKRLIAFCKRHCKH